MKNILIRRCFSYFLSLVVAVSTLSAISVFAPLQSSFANQITQSSFDFNTGTASQVMKTASNAGPIPASSNFSVESWVYVDADTNGWQTIMTQNQPDSSCCTGRFYMGFPGGRNLHIGFETGYTDVAVIPTTTWTHIALTLQRNTPSSGVTTTKTYINGLLVQNKTDWPNNTFSSANGFSIGTATNGGYKLNGKIDQVKIWDGVLSQADVQASMSAYAAGGISTGTLRAHYDFNEGTGTTITDRSGVSANLTVSAGDSVFSQTPTPPVTTSAAPTNLTVSAGYRQANVSWTAPTFNGGSTITGYTVTSSPSVSAPAACVNTANTSCTFTGLTAGTSYTFTVVATNIKGNSASSVASSSLAPYGDCSNTPTSSGGFSVLTFTSASTCLWTVPYGVYSAEVLVVGGGGGGNSGRCSISYGAGGGGGGVNLSTQSLTEREVIPITVGGGGRRASLNCAGATLDAGVPASSNGTNGSPSSFGTVSVNGGIAPDYLLFTGGASGNGLAGATIGNSTNPCGGTANGNNDCGAGGGGGALNAGSVLNGGAGITTSISGTSTMYGGGGPGKNNTTRGTSGDTKYLAESTPTANTGGGGSHVTPGADGVVIVKYVTPVLTTPSTPDLESASDTGETATDNITNDSTPTFTGTAAPGSEIQLQIQQTVPSGTWSNTGSPCRTDSLGAWSCTASSLSYQGANRAFRAVSTFDSVTTATSSSLSVSVWASGTITVSISRTDSGTPTIGINQTLGLSFATSRSIYDFAAADITVTGGSISNFVIVNSRAFTATFTPTPNASGNASISVGANKFFDTAGNSNSASTALSVAYNTVDSVAPTLSSGTISSITTTGATINFTSDESGTYFYLIYADATATPTAATVVAQGTAVAKGSSSALAAANSAAITGLTSATAYKAHIVVRDASENISTVLTISFSSYSTVATLSGLTLQTATISPTFLATTTSYTATVSNATSSITVTPTSTQANATIQVKVGSGSFASVTSGQASSSLNLAVGANTITVLVTAQDGTTTQSYEITVTRESSDATLSALVLSAGTLSPSFSASTTAYSASVAYATSSITVTPTRNQANATIQVKVGSGSYASVTSGSASSGLALAVGSNTVTILVTAQSGATQSYILTITRELQIQSPMTFSAATSRVNGFSFAVTNYSSSATYTATTSAGTVTIGKPNTTSPASLPFIVSGLNAGTSATVTITAVRSTYSNLVGTFTATSTSPGTSITCTPTSTLSGNTRILAFTATSATADRYCTWTVPADLTLATTIVVVGGGGGGGFYGNASGGGAGAVLTASNYSLTPGQVINITVGAGGAASAGTGAGPGFGGNNSVFNGVTAAGGGGGAGGDAGRALFFIDGASGGSGGGATVEGSSTYGNGVAGTSTAAAICACTSSGWEAFGNAGGSGTSGAGGGGAGSAASGSTPGSGKTFFTSYVLGVGGRGTGGSDTGSGGAVNTAGRAGIVLVAFPANLSTDAKLSNLAVSGVTLSPTFSSTTTSYSASVANTTTSVTVTPTRNQAAATITVNGTTVTSGSASGSISLNVGSNTVTIIVTAEDGTTTQTYTVVITRAGSSVATLSSLALTTATLSPTFASATTTYTSSVVNSTTSITVTPTRTQANATITVNGTAATSGSATSAISLNVGSNTITIVVTAQDGTTTQTYTVTVTRAASTVSTLSGLVVTTATLSPTFASGTTSYTSTVSNATTSITVTPTRTQANATITVNGTAATSGSATPAISLNVGSNTITIVVTAQDGTTTTYTVTVTRQSNDATLSVLTISQGTLSPSFAAATTSYTVTVINSISSITVTPTRTQVNATIQARVGAGSYSSVTSGSASSALALSLGSNTVNVLVTAQDGTTKTYTITVTRAPVISFINTLTAPTGIAMTVYQGITFSAATGGSGTFTYTYSINNTVNAALPTGLTFNGSSRSITGTPTTAGTTGTIKIIATDTNGDIFTMATGFSITINSGTQLALSIVPRFGTGGSPMTLFTSGGSGAGGLTYTLDPLVQSSCLLSGSVLTPNFATGSSGTCFVKATKAADTAFTATSSSTTAIFFTAYVPVVQQTFTCPAGTVPSSPSGIGVGSCIQVIAPVSPTAGDSGAAPKISSLSATSGLVGATITITGTGFSTVTRVQFGSKSTTTFTATSTTITVDVPTGATRGRIMVVSPTGTALAAQIFTVTALDTQAPGFTGGSVNTSTPTQLTLNFDETIDGTGVLATSFAVLVNGTSRAISSISISGTNITLTLASAVSATQTVDFTYTSPGDSTSIKDAAGNKTATITSTRLTNNLS